MLAEALHAEMGSLPPVPAPHVLDLVSRPWNLAIVAACMSGTRRFDDLQRQLGVNRKTLAHRLKWLVEEGVLHRSRYHYRPDRFEYHLTSKGQALLPTLAALTTWGQRWPRHESAADTAGQS